MKPIKVSEASGAVHYDKAPIDSVAELEKTRAKP